MAKATHPLELAFMRFDDTAERMFKRIEGSFRDLSGIPEVKQPKKRTKKTIYGQNPQTPFGGI
jgi:hypothetical protein|tara:strand:- start:520 stop:708 length:189 start_codon:yes stop_codon:yes gene_type:complete